MSHSSVCVWCQFHGNSLAMSGKVGLRELTLGSTKITMQVSVPEFREKACLEHVLLESVEGDAMSVVNAFDKFCRADAWMMNVGDTKGVQLDQIINTRINELQRPVAYVELGTYCGYSATRFGRLLPVGSTLVSFEVRPLIAAIATKIVEHAGLSSIVTVVPGGLNTHFHKLKPGKLDFVFLDHWKGLYKADLMRLESSGRLQVGSMVIADNCRIPGAPEFVEYVENNSNYDVRVIQSTVEYTDEVDHVYVCLVKEGASFLEHVPKGKL